MTGAGPFGRAPVNIIIDKIKSQIFINIIFYIIDCMKKILLLAAAALIVTSANAQLKRSETTTAPALPQVNLYQPEAKMEVAKMRVPGTPVVKKAQKKANSIEPWYRRPAGAFAASMLVEDGAYAGMLYAPYIAVKPYVDYTFIGDAIGQSENAQYEWDVQYWGYNDDYTDQIQKWETVQGTKELTWQYGYETDSVPVFYVIDGNEFVWWFIHGYEMNGTTPVNEYAADILAVPNTMDIWGYDFLKSSKSFVYGGRNGDQQYPMTYYSGADPYGDNENGWWFGKNGGTKSSSTGLTYRMDGIAQAFEKPTAPYLLNEVVLDCAVLEVAEGAQVDMTCKIYKLDEIPPYMDDDEATLPDEPGELIAMGRATVTSETEATTNGLVFFTLYGEEDGLEYDVTPTIDCAILVVIDGYNDPEMADLQDFSARISSDMDVDEGFGELAYLKFGIPDEDDNVDHYIWAGLNNFFSSGSMKTGFTIFLSTENPWLTYNYSAEDGEYLFPNEGGEMVKHFGDYTSNGIEFWAWTPSADDAWYVSCNDDEVPDWLNIELTDGEENGEFSGVVYAKVTAEPLPAGVKGREAIVRFEFPGAYLDYKFMQGEQGPNPEPIPGDVNGDGSVNIADINEVIDIILSGTFDAAGDINGDGSVNIADINALIAIILK